MLRLILPGIVLLLSMFTGHSQKISEYKFSVLNANNGFAGKFALDILQDHNGYMWFGTDGGLQRYDGKRFLTFRNRPGDLKSIPHNTVDDLYEDRNGNLWIVTADDRVGIFNTARFTYEEVPVPNQKKEGLLGIKHIMEDNDGNLFLAIEQQEKPFYLYSPKNKTFLPATINEALPDKWPFAEFFYDKNTNRFWLTSDSGLIVYDPVRRLSSYRGHNVTNDPVIARLGHERFVVVPFVDEEKNFWCVTMPGIWEPPVIHRFETATAKYDQYIPFKDIRTSYRQIKTIFSQKNGRIWICGLPFLMEYKKGQTPIFDTIPVNDNCNPKSLTFNAAVTMVEDRDHTLWMGTTHGVVRFTPDANLFSNYMFKKDRSSLPGEQSASALFERKNGELWVGTIDDGLYTFNKDFEPVTAKGDPVAQLSSKAVYSIHEHSVTGLIWMGYGRDHLAIYNPETGQTEIWDPLFMKGYYVHKITEDKNGNLWFITSSYGKGGLLVKWDRKLAANDYKKGFVVVNKGGYVNTLVIDNKNAVWVNFSGQGLEKFHTETNKTELRIMPEYRDRTPGIWENNYSDIVQYNDSLLVAVGNVVTIINIRNNSVSHISKIDGLPGNLVAAQKDKNGIIWATTYEGGICRFNPERKVFTLYNKADGMIDDIFVHSASASLSDGRLVFMASSCLVVLNPADMIRTASAPAAQITDFKMLNISLPVDSLKLMPRVHLPYDKNSVTIEFSALNFASQDKFNYSYQMEGLDKDWVAADETQRAIYNYLPAGKYTFRIKTDNGTSGKSAITTMQLTVHAAFWKTAWFWSLIALVLAGVLFLLDRERVKRLVSLQKMRTEIAINLHKDVSSTLNNINLLSEMARIKADKDLDRSKEYIQQISDKSNNMIVAMNDILWSIEPENDSMERSLLRMREFIDALKNRYNSDIVLIADRQPARITLDMKKRHEFFLIFKEALRVVVELAEGRETLVHLDTSKNKLVLKLQDATANPFSQQAALDEAIRDIHTRTSSIRAETDIQYDQKGIDIIIQLPLN